MLDHPIVDVALGLFLLYSTLSLVAFGREGVGFQLPWAAGEETPGGDSDPDREGPRLSAVWASSGQYAAKEKKLPSYIGSGTFASVLVDLLAHDEFHEDHSGDVA